MDVTEARDGQPETATIVHTLPQAAVNLLATAALHGWTGSVSLEHTRLPGSNLISECLRVEAADPSGARLLWQQYPSTLPDAQLVTAGARLPGSEYLSMPLSTAGQLRFIAEHSATDDE